MRAVHALSAALLLLVAAAASAQEDPCDPLVPESCMLPFPNNYWTVADSSTSSGLRLNIQPETFPIDKEGRVINPNVGGWNLLDGFSATPVMSSYFADMSLEGVPGHEDISPSLREDCPTVLLDTVTLERLPHWGELDESTPDTNLRAFMVWPVQRLVGGRRYIMAIRNLVNSTTGLPCDPSQAFYDLRQNQTSSIPTVNERMQYFNEYIFDVLEEAGVERSNLQLAWDFTVGSDQSITGRMISMRDDGLPRLPEGGPKYWIEAVEDNPGSNTARKIKGKMEVPLYLNQPNPGVGVHLVLDSDGIPVFQGWANTTFTVTIPNSLVSAGKGGQVVEYGHGLFGDQDEVNSGYLQEEANTYGYVMAATNWWGMDMFDVVPVTEMLTFNLTDFQIIPDRCQQGFLNFLCLTRLMMGNFTSDPNMMYNGVSMIDTSLGVAYNGNSQGGIYGASVMAISQDILRGDLGVPGAPYALLLPRSVDFTPYFVILKYKYENPFDRINVLSVLQLLWDRADPSGYMSFVTSNPLPNTPAKQIIINYSLGDSQVSWLGAYCMGRSMGAFVFPHNVVEEGEVLYGFPVAESSVTTALLQGYSYGAPPVPNTNIPPSQDIDTHSCSRKDPRQQAQMASFFSSGIITNYCDGPCLEPTDPPVDGSNCQQSYPAYYSPTLSKSFQVQEALFQLKRTHPNDRNLLSELSRQIGYQ